ncbi:MAG: DUF3467 domain-containing protein [Elusimicrobiota bacterium]
MSEKKQQKQIKIKLDEETAMGKYSNIGTVSHTPEEFIVDYLFLPPGSDQAKVISRIITSPGHAKRLFSALKDNIEKYEKKFGKIMPSEGKGNKIGF